MQQFLFNFESVMQNYFLDYHVETIVETPKSLQARIHLDSNCFLSLRHNERNNRTDVALIKNGQRIFGYDNLKTWHFHPYENPSEHIPCKPPSIEKMISEVKKYYEIDKKKTSKVNDEL